ncbi:hypothetical protein [Corynebacterium sp. CCM 9203]|uniref:hypothetical protein n=1 Tax=Corynebacterium sp. CCM 9203 TaxID=3057615 RepID=UPI0035264C08
MALSAAKNAGATKCTEYIQSSDGQLIVSATLPDAEETKPPPVLYTPAGAGTALPMS